MARLRASAISFQRLVQQLGLAAAQRVAAMWENTDGWQDVEEQYPLVVDPFTAASGQLAAQWYQDLNPNKPFEVRVSGLPEDGQLKAVVGFAFTQTNPLTALVGAADRFVFSTARQTVVDNAKREKVLFARHASATACEWCQVLATNEPRYLSEESATAGHDNCHCIAVPVREGTEWTPAPYVKEWEQNYADARDAVGGDLNDITNYLRKQNYADNKDALNERRRELYAAKQTED